MRLCTDSFKTIFIATLLLFPAMHAFAGEKITYDRIQLTAHASAETENDTLTAVLSVQRKGENFADLATEVNRVTTQALKQARQVKGVDVRTLNYQTKPVYEKQHQTGWQVSQSIQLISHDSTILSRLLGKLQDKFMLVSMAYSVSPQQQQRVKENLIGKAITAFEQRARDITHALHRKHYRLVNMQVDTGENINPPPNLHTFERFSAARSAPALEAGKQMLTVTVSGEIELQLN